MRTFAPGHRPSAPAGRADGQPRWALFNHADTGIGAQDMDALRRALGEQKISYHGISYGTLLGQQYAEKFGGHVRAMLLDSNIDHSVDLRHFTVDRAAAADDAFLELVHWCDRTATCVLHGQDVLATWQQALDAADLHRCPETGCGTGCSATCTARRTTTSPS